MPLNSGTRAPGSPTYGGNMAAAMEKAFREEWPYVMGDADLPASNEQLNLMFRAVAQGVIRHLQENCTSLKVTAIVNIGGINYTANGTVSDIEIS